MVSDKVREYPGIWWTPKREENRIKGTLVFNPVEGLQLDSNDSFNGVNTFSTEATLPLVFGESDQGEKITLQECKQVKGEVRVEGQSRTTSAEYQCERALIGGHFFDEKAQFKEVQVQIPWLTEWAGVSGMEISGSLVSGKNNNESNDDFVLKYNFPELPAISINDQSIQLRANTSIEVDWGGRAIIDEEIILQIETVDGARTLSKYVDIINAFCAFLSLAIKRQIRPTRILGFDHSNEQNRSRVDVLSSTIRPTNGEDSLDRNEIVFRYQDLEPEVDQIFRSWFDKYDDLEPILDLYFSVVYGNKSYYRDQIITILGTLEAYHQAQYEDQYITVEDIETYFKNRGSEDIIQITRDSFDEFQSEFESVQYPSLRYRLVELIQDTEPIKNVLHGEYESQLDRVISVRNDLVHGSDVSLEESEEATVFALPEMIMEGILLAEVGLSSEKIEAYLTRSYPDLTREA